MRLSERRLTWLKLLLFGTIATALSLVILGVFDPRPIGRLVPAAPPGPITIDEETRLFLAAADDASFSVRLRGVWRSGERDIGYGLLLTNDEGDVWGVAVSPLGFLSVWQSDSSGRSNTMPWRPWPHVQPADNEIWLDVRGTDVTVRINRELLSLEPTRFSCTPCRVSLWADTFGRVATVDFSRLELTRDVLKAEPPPE